MNYFQISWQYHSVSTSKKQYLSGYSVLTFRVTSKLSGCINSVSCPIRLRCSNVVVFPDPRYHNRKCNMSRTDRHLCKLCFIAVENVENDAENPCKTLNEHQQTQLTAGPDLDLNGIGFLNIQREIWQSTWAPPTALFHCSSHPLVGGIISPKERSCKIQSSALHGTNEEGVFPDKIHFYSLLLWEDYLRCVSLPPTVALCHLRPVASCGRPKAVHQPLPPPSSPSDPPSLCIQSSFKETFDYWMPLAWRITHIPIFQWTAYIFIVAWAWAYWRRLRSFAQWRTRWSSADFQNEFRRGHAALPLLSKQLCPLKSKCCDFVFITVKPSNAIEYFM